jgi:hypothetical protein
MNENNLTIYMRDLKEIRSRINKSTDGKFTFNGKDYPCDKEKSSEMITNLIDIIRQRNGIIYG